MSSITDDERILGYGRLVETQRRLHRAFGRSFRERAGISFVSYEALLRLDRAPDEHVSINELGGAMDLTSGGATRLVDRLEAEGLVERSACPTDRRVHWIGLTAEGRRLLVEATKVHLPDLEDFFWSRLTKTEQSTLHDLLRKVMPTE